MLYISAFFKMRFLQFVTVSIVHYNGIFSCKLWWFTKIKLHREKSNQINCKCLSLFHSSYSDVTLFCPPFILCFLFLSSLHLFALHHSHSVLSYQFFIFCLYQLGVLNSEQFAPLCLRLSAA